MPTLHIQLLGELNLVYDDAPLRSIRSPRLQALFAFLVLHRQTPHNRQQLAFQFWSDSGEAQARANLRFFLHQLRRALPDVERFLQIDESTVLWRADAPFTLDVAVFEAALADAARVTDSEAAPLLKQAVALYQGELLPSCYDDWILPERERLQQLYIGALGQLSRGLELAHDYREAILYAQRLLRYDPLHEDTYRHLMRLQVEDGDRVGALRTFHTCVAVLERELGVEPGKQTRALYEQLLEGAAAPAETTRRAAADFAALHVPGVAPNNLRLALTSFIGRERELNTVKQLLATARLVTLTGVGGSGKTRLAREVSVRLLLAEHEHPTELAYADGIWWVELVALHDSTLVGQAVADVLGVRAQRLKSMRETLLEFLAHKQLLLVLDNCEHLIDACAELVETLLPACPGVRVLATSREPLKVAGEIAWSVPPLSKPELAPIPSAEAYHKLAYSEAVRLFCERAALAFPVFELTQDNAPAVAQICRELDGLPLALELAAARVKVLTVQQIAARLDDRFNLLKAAKQRGNLHHQSLRALMDWSFDLLVAAERELFQKLAVFDGGFTLEAVEQVCAGDKLHDAPRLELLSLLVDKSLVMVQQESGEARFDLLETIRQYASEKLRDSGASEAMQRKHARYYLAFAEQGKQELEGPQQRLWLERMERDHDNLRAALRWTVEHDDLETALRFAGALALFWNGHGHAAEGCLWLETILAQSGNTVSPARAEALLRLGELMGLQEDYAAARLRLEQSLELWQALGDTRGVIEVLLELAHKEFFQGDAAGAHRRVETALGLAREIGDTRGMAFALYRLGNFMGNEGNPAAARELFEQSLALFRTMGWRSRIALVLNGLGELARMEGDDDRAAELYQESLTLYQELDDKWRIAVLLNNLGFVLLHRGEYIKAKAAFIESLELWSALEAPLLIPESLTGLAGLLNAGGMPTEAVRLLAAATAFRDANQIIWEKTDWAEVDRIMDVVQQRMDSAAFEHAWSAGSMLTQEQATQEAFADVRQLK